MKQGVPDGSTNQAMVSQCANPKCQAPFLYLREGRLLALRHRSALPEESRIEFFWLCADCCKHLALEVANGAANLVPRQRLEAAKEWL